MTSVHRLSKTLSQDVHNVLTNSQRMNVHCSEAPAPRPLLGLERSPLLGMYAIEGNIYLMAVQSMRSKGVPVLVHAARLRQSTTAGFP